MRFEIGASSATKAIGNIATKAAVGNLVRTATIGAGPVGIAFNVISTVATGVGTLVNALSHRNH